MKNNILTKVKLVFQDLLEIEVKFALDFNDFDAVQILKTVCNCETVRVLEIAKYCYEI